jgi:hypothetical protein
VLHSFLGWHPDGNVQLERHLGREFGGGVNLAGGGGLCWVVPDLRRQTKPKMPFGICHILDVVAA